MSYNRPRFHPYATWVANGITFAGSDIVGNVPNGIFVDTNNTVYLANRESSRIYVWQEGQPSPSRNFTLPSSTFPLSIFATSNGDIFIPGSNASGRVDKLTPTMTNISISVMSVSDFCHGIFVDITNVLYCSLYSQNVVIAKSLTSTDDTWTIAAGTGCAGTSPNRLNGPFGVFVNTNLELYVADSLNNRIQVFSPDRVEARTVAITGTYGWWTLSQPRAMILDGDGYLFISDTGFNRILGSGPHGFRCIIGCGSAGSLSNQLTNPCALSFDSYGNLFVADRNNSRIQKFNLIPNTFARKY